MLAFFCSLLLSLSVGKITDLSPTQKATVEQLTLKGDFNNKGGNDDFRQLRDLCCRLQQLDLSMVTCDSMRANALHSRHQLKKLQLPNKLRVIGSQALFACDHLREITIPATVERIESRAFGNCRGLRKITFLGAQQPKIASDAFVGVDLSKVKIKGGFSSLQLEEDLLAVAVRVPSFVRKPALVPYPVCYQQKEEMGVLLEDLISCDISAPACLQNEKEQLINVLKERLSMYGKKREGVKIVLSICDTLKKAESYVLKISNSQIHISGADAAGVFYGIMTLDQLIASAKVRNIEEINATYVYDAPRTKMRELMVDPCRHFIPYSDLEMLVKEMARYKMNALHLHLVDDQAWRIQIKSYPLLTKKGSSRVGMDDMLEPISGYYTQKQMRRLVKYAHKYHVDIIPEIEMPGHEVAAIHCYPQLSCGGKVVPIRTTCGVSNELLCASNAFTYEFLENVFSELATVFDSPYVHLGGDEAGNPALDCWTHCPSCQQMKQDLGITTKSGSENWRLQKVLFDRIISFLRDRLHKTPMFWYETDFREIQAGCVIFAWRHGLTQKAIEAAIANQSKIMLCPGEHCYLDYPAKRGDMPEVNWGMPTTTLQQTYKLDPAWGNGATFENIYLFGVAGTLWSECINSTERLFYMAFPRALALAEAGWTPQYNRNYEDFLQRIRLTMTDMHQRGICTADY